MSIQFSSEPDLRFMPGTIFTLPAHYKLEVGAQFIVVNRPARRERYESLKTLWHVSWDFEVVAVWKNGRTQHFPHYHVWAESHITVLYFPPESADALAMAALAKLGVI